MFACLHGNGNLTALAFEFSPVVEQTAPDTVTLDASGLDRLFGFPQDVAAAIARRAAEIRRESQYRAGRQSRCRHLRGARICRASASSRKAMRPSFWARCRSQWLAPSPELRETLERWGIRRFRDLAALPPLGIAERLGPEGLRLRELARGEAERKLVPLEEPLEFEDQIELEYPVELLEPLAFLLARLLNGLAARLATRALATDELRLRLKLENRATHERTLRLPVPSLDTKAFLKLLQLDLAAHPPAAPIVHVWMGMNPVKPRAAQGGLFVPLAPEPVKLELTLARIQAIVGEGRVGSPELLDTHRPEAFRMVQSGAGQSARARRSASCRPPDWPCASSVPPRAARVALASGQPSFVAADGIRGKVLELAGPWRTSGDWWTTDPWSRDEWDIALSDGALYRIYCEPRGWFVEGSYD